MRTPLGAVAVMLVSLVGCGVGPVVPPCGPHNCAGCCTAEDACSEENSREACGQQGSACAACGTYEVCSTSGACEGQSAACAKYISILSACCCSYGGKPFCSDQVVRYSEVGTCWTSTAAVAETCTQECATQTALLCQRTPRPECQ